MNKEKIDEIAVWIVIFTILILLVLWVAGVIT